MTTALRIFGEAVAAVAGQRRRGPREAAAAGAMHGVEAAG